MLTLLLGPLNETTTRARLLRSRALWGFNFLAILSLAALIVFFSFRQAPSPSMIAWILYLVGLVGCIASPRWGLYLIVFLSLVGDAYLLPWYPFTKNFSSRESLLFLHDALIINPLETYLIAAYLSWLGRGALGRKLEFYRGPLFWPALAFLGFIILGFIYGFAIGGNLNIALWEARPLFYLVAILILTGNVLTRKEHYIQLLWAAILALLIESLIGTYYVLVDLGGSLDDVTQITEHSAAVHINTIFIFLVAALMYKAFTSRKLAISLVLPFVLLPYLANQRRAAFVSLIIALALLAILLYYENRRLFWVVVPLAGCVGLVYLVAFWNSTGAIGLPAQALKSVISPSQASAADYSSTVYRMIENYNLEFTIHQKPLTGVGFGNKFYVIIPMADISFFTWWQYFPHNSVIWIWLKTGVGGFIAMLYLLGTALLTATRALLRLPDKELKVITLAATLFVLMHFIYAYVDISWDIQSMVYLGVMLGVINSVEHMASQPVPLPQRRWHWQPVPEPAPELRPF